MRGERQRRTVRTSGDGRCTLRRSDDRSFAFAGLWESWEGDDQVVESCALLTTEPNELVRSVGHHRVPVLLSNEDEYQLWLNLDAGRSAVEHLFAPTVPRS
jgi:putative SOS response-associated peptidase YedK